MKAKIALHKGFKGNISLTQKLELELDLNDEVGERPEWFEHPQWRHRADMVLLRIPTADLDVAGVERRYLAECAGFQSNYRPEVMNDVFVIGYPWALHGGDGVLPLYQRGSIASEPVVNYSGLPRVLIDCRTNSGSSGSPVIVSHSGIWMPTGVMSDDSIIGTLIDFLGVYSGRLESAAEATPLGDKQSKPSEIGVVWRKELLDEILAAEHAGSKLSVLL